MDLKYWPHVLDILQAGGQANHKSSMPCFQVTNREGKLHRVGGPAQIIIDFDLKNIGLYWYENSLLHRPDGPAVTWKDFEAWYLNGKLHRVGGPATSDRGDLYWYNNGCLHRVDGPAIITKSGRREWWINNEHVRTEV